LSLIHGDDYPYVTSRDTTASAFASEAGIGPTKVDRVIVCIRTFPIRSGFVGALMDEITWDLVRELGNHNHDIEDSQKLATVTGRTRRVGKFDLDFVQRSVVINGATHLAISMIDYLNCKDEGVTDFDKLSDKARMFIQKASLSTSVPTWLVGTGPNIEHTIVLRTDFEPR